MRPDLFERFSTQELREEIAHRERLAAERKVKVICVWCNGTGRWGVTNICGLCNGAKTLSAVRAE